MVSCAACGYSKTPKNKNSGVTFHRFPKNKKQRLLWVSFVKHPGFIPDNRSLLCSRHFTEACFNRSYDTFVRLFPSAIPTIQIERLKYVRTFNEEIFHESKTHDLSPEPSEKKDFPPIPKPSDSQEEELSLQMSTESTTLEEEESPLQRNLKEEIKKYVSPIREPSTVEEDESTCLRNLKRKISCLEKLNKLKSTRIRSLQKINWRQKKQISFLKAMMVQMKNRNLLLDEHSNVYIKL